jgi:hypothetical protein
MCGLTCLVFWWAIGPSAVVLDSILANRHLIITEHTYETLHFDFFGTSPRDAASVIAGPYPRETRSKKLDEHMSCDCFPVNKPRRAYAHG